MSHDITQNRQNLDLQIYMHPHIRIYLMQLFQILEADVLRAGGPRRRWEVPVLEISHLFFQVVDHVLVQAVW